MKQWPSTSMLSPGERRTQVAGVWGIRAGDRYRSRVFGESGRETVTGRGCLGNQGGRPYAKRPVRGPFSRSPYFNRVACRKKPGGEMKFSSRVNVWFLAPKSFRSREAH